MMRPPQAMLDYVLLQMAAKSAAKYAAWLRGNNNHDGRPSEGESAEEMPAAKEVL